MPFLFKRPSITQSRKENGCRQSRGSALLAVLAFISIITVLAVGFLQLNFFETRYNRDYGNYIQAKWAVAGMERLFRGDLKNNRVNLEYLKRKETVNDAACVLEFVPEGNGVFSLSVRGEKGGKAYTLKKKALCLSFTHFSIFYNGSLSVPGREAESFIPAPVHAAGDIKIFPAARQRINFYSEADFPAYLEAGGKTGYFPQQGASVKIGVKKEDEWVKYLTAEAESDLDSPEFVKNSAPEISLPEIREIFKSKMEYKTGTGYIESAKNRAIKKILNPLLLEKELIGLGPPSSEGYELPDKNRRTRTVYFKKTGAGSRYQKTDPVKYADSRGIPGQFTLLNGKLRIRTDEKVKLDILKLKLEKLNYFPYAGKDFSYASLDRNIGTVFLDGKACIEGNHIEIDPEKREIYFYSPDFTGLIGTGDGVKKEFALPEQYAAPLHVFIGNNRASGFSVKENRIIFDRPVEYGKKVSFYKRLPDISFIKNRPDHETAVLIDREIEAVSIDLDSFRYPDDHLVISGLPLYVRGKAASPLCIISTNDVYLGSVNKKGGEPVSVLARHIWLYDEEESDIELRDVYLFTEGDGIYIVDPDRMQKAIIRGAVTLGARDRNMTNPLEPDNAFKNSFVYSSQGLWDIRWEFSSEIRKPAALYIPYIFSEKE